jgi:hypothetical protein
MGRGVMSRREKYERGKRVRGGVVVEWRGGDRSEERVEGGIEGGDDKELRMC